MYYDVIPDHLFDVSRYTDFIAWLLSFPIHYDDRLNIFISWSKEVGYIYSKADLDKLK